MDSREIEDARVRIRDFFLNKQKEIKSRARSDRDFCGAVFYECSVYLATQGFASLSLEEFQKLFHAEVFT